MIRLTQVTRALAWSGAERLGGAVLLLGSALVIGREIGPEAFGLGSLVLSLVVVLQIAAERLFHEVIVRRPELEDGHVGVALLAATGLGVVLYGMLALASGPLARLYGHEELQGLILLAGIGVPISAPAGVAVAVLHRRMAYRPLAWRMLAAVACGALAGVVAAFLDAGALALVVQMVVQWSVAAVGAFLAVVRLPRPSWNTQRFRELAGFSATVLVETLVYAGSFRLFMAIVGATSGVQVVGYLELASRLALTLSNLWTSATSPVVLNILSAVQASRDALGRAYLQASELNALAVIPMFVGIALVAGDLIALAAGPQWMPVTPVLQVLAIECAVRLSRQFTSQVYYAVGRPMLGLIGALIGLVVANGLLLVFAPDDPAWIAVLWAVRQGATAVYGLWMLRALTGLTPWQLYRAMWLPILATAAMVVGVLLVQALLPGDASALIRLGVSATAGALIYVGVLALVRPSLIDLARNVLRNLRDPDSHEDRHPHRLAGSGAVSERPPAPP